MEKEKILNAEDNSMSFQDQEIRRYSEGASRPVKYLPRTPTKRTPSKFVVPNSVSAFPLSSGRKLEVKIGSSIKKSSLLSSTPTQHAADYLDFHGHSRSSSPTLRSRYLSNLSPKPLFDHQEGFDDELLSNDYVEDQDDTTFLDPFDVIDVSWRSKEPVFHCHSHAHWEHRHFGGNYLDGNYETIEDIGAGSFSRVVKVCSHVDGLEFALKCSNTQFHGAGERLRKLNEPNNMWKCRDHPNVLRIECCWEQTGYLYILSEYCDRGSIRSVMECLQEAKMAPQITEIWRFAQQLASGIAHIHACGIIHMDLKPDNILLKSDGTIKIADFGLSFSCDEATYDMDSEGDKYYVAPEVLNGIYSQAADMFSFGLILLELISGLPLPPSGEGWLALRSGSVNLRDFGIEDLSLSTLIEALIHPNPSTRPAAKDVAEMARLHLI